MTSKSLAPWLLLIAVGVASVFLVLLMCGGPTPPPSPRDAPPRGERDITPVRLAPRPPGGVEGPSFVLRVTVQAMVEGDLGPVAGATVVCLGGVEQGEEVVPTSERMEGSTQGSGIVELTLPRTGLWRIVALAPGFVGTSQAFRFEDEAGGIASVELLVTPLAVLAGRVRDARGAPVGEGLVVALPPPDTARTLALLHPEDRARARTFRTQTDAHGRFRLESVIPGVELVLQVRHPVAGRTELPVSPLSPGEMRRVDVELRGRTLLRGRVEGPWEAAEDLVVECWHRAGGKASQLVLQARVQVDRGTGEFEIVDVSPGAKTLHYARRAANALYLGYAEAEAVEGESRDVGLIPIGHTELVVTVLPDGAVPAGERVRLAGQVVVAGEQHVVHPFRVLVVPEEPFTIHGLPEGQLNLSATLMDPSGKSPSMEFEPASRILPQFGASGRVEEILVLANRRLDRKGGVVVVLTPPPDLQGAPIDARLVVEREGIVLHTLPRSTEGVTVFPLGGFDPGSVAVHVAANGWRAVRSVQVRAGEPTRVEVRDWLRAPTHSGHVTDARGAAVPGATVQVVQADPSGKEFTRLIDEVVSDKEGRFLFRGLPAVPGLSIQAGVGAGRSAPRGVDPNVSEDRLILRFAE